MSSEQTTVNESDKIWSEIKNKDIEMYALPGKKLEALAKPAVVEPSKCYLVSSNPSLLATLEVVLAPKYAVDRADKYIVISRKKMG